jgi:hypothetical protein
MLEQHRAQRALEEERKHTLALQVALRRKVDPEYDRLCNAFDNFLHPR